MTTFRDEGFEMVGESINSGFVAVSLANAIALTGSNQATGTVLQANVNVIASGSVCVLPLGAPAGARIDVVNEGAAVVTPFPPTGGAIDNRAANASSATIAALSANLPGIAHYVALGSGNYVTV